MNFEKRLRALEASLVTEPVVLYFANGSTRELHGGGDLVLRLFRCAFAANLNPTHAAELSLIRECVGSEEPGGGHMIELLHSILHAQSDAQDGIDVVGA